MERQIISRKDAKASKLMRYFTGTPCSRGHVSERYVSGYVCVDCQAAKAAAWQSANMDLCVARATAWCAANPEKHRASADAWRKANPGHVSAWLRANPDKATAIARNRYARKKAADGRHTADDIERIYAEQCGGCACCGSELNGEYEVDHIVPLLLGGTNWPDNVQCLCVTCNRSKGHKHPAEFASQYFKRRGVWPLFAIARGYQQTSYHELDSK
jgi:5-methylcytosine-specific restriction endonuclease McrA